MAKKKSAQELKSSAAKTMPVPSLPYQPARTRKYNPPIGLIGCGGISGVHLRAYKAAGYNVVALCDLIPERAENRRKEFFPQAQTYTDYKDLLARTDIEVIDIATHPQDRSYLIPAALRARKHVLSQKPFVLDLDLGAKFAALAKANNVALAVNQNGRWAPYFSWMRQAVKKGLIGETMAVHLQCHWDHEWIKNVHFDKVHHIVLYDFAIHYFDALHCLMNGKTPRRVTASLTHAPKQQATPPLLGQVLVEYDNAQATLVFDACTKFAPLESAYVTGTEGTLHGTGPLCAIPAITLTTKRGTATTPKLEGSWFPTGFHGTMGELLQSIEQRRTPVHSATDNLEGLAICFAAVASSESGKPVEVGKARKVPVERCSVAAAK